MMMGLVIVEQGKHERAFRDKEVVSWGEGPMITTLKYHVQTSWTCFNY